MKTVKSLSTLSIILFAGLSGLGQSSPMLQYLPVNAKTIVKINPASLGQKITWEELVKYKMVGELMKDMPEQAKEFLNKSAQTGIDLSQGLFFAIPANKTDDPVFFAVPGDTSLVSAMVRKIFPGRQAIRTTGGKFIVDKHTALAWNNEVVMLTGDDAKKGSADPKEKASPAAESIKAKQLADRCKTLLAKHQPGVAANKDFTSLLREKGDVLYWVDNGVRSAEKNSKLPPSFGMLNKGFMQKGSYASGIINFENGKITMQMKQYVSAELDSLYKKYPSSNINADLIRKLPDGHPIALFAFSFSPEMVSELYAKSGMDKQIDSISKQKIRMNEVLQAVKGDVMASLMKVDDIDESDSATRAMNGLELFVSGHINDKEKFNSLVNVLMTKKNDSGRVSPAKTPKAIVLSNDSVFVLSFSNNAGQKFLSSAGSSEAIQKAILPYERYPALFMIDLRTIFGFGMQAVSKGKPEEEVRKANEVLNTFDKLISYGGRYDNKILSTTIDLSFVNKDENSLKQILNLIELFNSLKPKASTARN